MPFYLYSNCERHIIALIPTIVNLTIGLLIKKCCLYFQPPTCTCFYSFSWFLYVFFANFTAMLWMYCSLKNKSLNNSPFILIISFTRALCLFMIWYMERPNWRCSNTKAWISSNTWIENVDHKPLLTNPWTISPSLFTCWNVA